MKLPFFQIDAFAQVPFSGNPAAVVPLERWLPDSILQAIAAENNLAETAFPFRDVEGKWHIRWFTPTIEVDLCGHATLAAAWVVFHRLAPSLSEITFTSQSGPLRVTQEGDRLTLDFPSRPVKPIDAVSGLTEALGAKPHALFMGQRDLLAVFKTEDEVKALAPRMDMLAALPLFGIVPTAPGREVVFVSRYFAPAIGVPEDPATGSTHCSLTPYWAQVLGKSELLARQISRRGAQMHCRLDGDRVHIGGPAVLLIEGNMLLPDIDT